MADVGDPYWAVIFQPWRDEPVMHKLDFWGAFKHRTACGRTIGSNKPLLPMKHAKKFATQCKGCFPE